MLQKAEARSNDTEEDILNSTIELRQQLNPDGEETMIFEDKSRLLGSVFSDGPRANEPKRPFQESGLAEPISPITPTRSKHSERDIIIETEKKQGPKVEPLKLEADPWPEPVNHSNAGPQAQPKEDFGARALEGLKNTTNSMIMTGKGAFENLRARPLALITKSAYDTNTAYENYFIDCLDKFLTVYYILIFIMGTMTFFMRDRGCCDTCPLA